MNLKIICCCLDLKQGPFVESQSLIQKAKSILVDHFRIKYIYT